MNWISVKDSLPKEGESVCVLHELLTLNDAVSPTKKIGIGYLCCAKGWVIEIDARYPTIKVGNITHWMPLPEKPDQE